MDPFDGNPVRYRRLTDGVVIYSIGQDGKDDGGQVSHTPAVPRPQEMGYRLWDVAKRRTPAKMIPRNTAVPAIPGAPGDPVEPPRMEPLG